jgi:phage repressor protein C with HTH and peptisase S24 domain
MRHDDVWRALDTLAAERGLSASGLARRAGLDPTAFNPSKRRAADGRARWPSTESLAKVLMATGASLEAFTALVTGSRTLPQSRPTRRVPFLPLAQATDEGRFDGAGYPVGIGWDEMAVPEVADPHAYALQVSSSGLEPVYRDGDTLLVSPAAPIRRGDRIVARTVRGEVMTRQIARRSARRIELHSLNPADPDRSFALENIAWMHRIVWASQ